VLVANKKHGIVILTRRDVPDATRNSYISYQKTDYSSVEELKEILQGVEVVLSFIAPYMDQEEAFNAQKNLIDASVKADVKRFAPSEWASYVYTSLSLLLSFLLYFPRFLSFDRSLFIH
jgi:saccharopine dehydrogenase-like NADP-dependent oxidoreductase